MLRRSNNAFNPQEVILDGTTQDDEACEHFPGRPLLGRLSLCGCGDVTDRGVFTLLLLLCA